MSTNHAHNRQTDSTYRSNRLLAKLQLNKTRFQCNRVDTWPASQKLSQLFRNSVFVREKHGDGRLEAHIVVQFAPCTPTGRAPVVSELRQKAFAF